MNARLRSLRSAVLGWYRSSRRDLPWRRTSDPYAIWVSEIMLQQTRVETVIPYYERFLERFPTVERLARAAEPDVLAAWSGLGYYSRARALHAAAKIVARDHAGRLPEDPVLLRTLPGIGPYTAAAIASVAYGRPIAAVDGNVIRVLARIAGWRGRRDESSLRRSVEAFAAELAAGASPGDWTQALMELGALICTPRAPRCGDCPAASRCTARRSGSPAAFPEPARVATDLPRRRLVLLLARRGARVLLVPEGQNGGEAWSLPAAELPDEAKGAAAEAAARLSKGWVDGGAVAGPTRRFRHRTYAEDLRYEVWELREGADPSKRVARSRNREPERPAGEATAAAARWVDPKRLDDLPVRGPTLKALKGLARQGRRT